VKNDEDVVIPLNHNPIFSEIITYPTEKYTSA